jgi:hypothetical protein
MRDDGEDAEAAATAGAGEDIVTESVTHPACQALRPAPRLWSSQGDRIGSGSRLRVICSNSAGGTLPKEL